VLGICVSTSAVSCKWKICFQSFSRLVCRVMDQTIHLNGSPKKQLLPRNPRDFSLPSLLPKKHIKPIFYRLTSVTKRFSMKMMTSHLFLLLKGIILILKLSFSSLFRGVVEKPKMQLSFPRGSKQEPICEKISSPVSIMNGNIIPIQLFYQNLRNVFDLPLAPGDTEIRSIFLETTS
jgi:hypothetical protein